MAIDHPLRSAAEQQAHRDQAFKTFRDSGVVDVVDRIREFLPEGVEVTVVAEETPEDKFPYVTFLGPTYSSSRTEWEWGTGDDWNRRLYKEVPTEECMRCTVGVLGATSSMLDIQVVKNEREINARGKGWKASPIYTGAVHDPKDRGQLGARLHHGLKDAFTFTPAQEAGLRGILPSPAPRQITWGPGYGPR